MNPSVRSKSFSKLPLIIEQIEHFNKQNIQVSFLAIVETWLKDHITAAQLHIKDYNLYRSDRAVSRNGGSLLYIHNSIVIDSFLCYDDDTCNGVVCFSKKSNCIICSVYRPPNSSQLSFFNLLQFVSNFISSNNANDKIKVFLFGDFNFPDISWQTNCVTEYLGPSAIVFKNLVDKHTFSQYSTSSMIRPGLAAGFLKYGRISEIGRIRKILTKRYKLIKKTQNIHFSCSEICNLMTKTTVTNESLTIEIRINELNVNLVY